MKNTVLLGLVAGLPLLLLAFLLTRYTSIVADIMPSKPIGMYVIAVALNLCGVWWAYRNDRQELGRGIVLATFLVMLLGVFTKTISF